MDAFTEGRAANGGSPNHRARHRQKWRSLLFCVAAGGILVLLACEDSPSSIDYQGVLLEQPLTLEWSGKDAGAPFQYEGVFMARTNLRVKWKFRLETKPADPDDPRFPGDGSKLVYKTEFTSQDRIQFSWNITQTMDSHVFMLGDTCTASISVLPELAPGEEPKTVFQFVIGG